MLRPNQKLQHSQLLYSYRPINGSTPCSYLLLSIVISSFPNLTTSSSDVAFSLRMPSTDNVWRVSTADSGNHLCSCIWMLARKSFLKTLDHLGGGIVKFHSLKLASTSYERLNLVQVRGGSSVLLQCFDL